MTANRDLKRRVRERQARTGESYMAALHHVRAQRPIHIPTVELLDVTATAAAVGLRCRVSMGPRLAHRADVRATLQSFHDLVASSASNRSLFLMRSVALFDVNATVSDLSGAIQEGHRFARRVRAGLGGVSDHGRLLALPWVPPTNRAPATTDPALDSASYHLAVYALWMSPAFVPCARPPLLLVTTHDEFTADDPQLSAAADRVFGEAP